MFFSGLLFTPLFYFMERKVGADIMGFVLSLVFAASFIGQGFAMMIDENTRGYVITSILFQCGIGIGLMGMRIT